MRRTAAVDAAAATTAAAQSDANFVCLYLKRAVFGDYFLKYLRIYCTELNAVFGVS